MKIATWNIARFIPKNQNEILIAIQKLNAEIIVLTETFNSIEIEGCNCIHTKLLPSFVDTQVYRNGEVRTSIFSKYSFKRMYKTYNEYTSVCADIETPIGEITVYASIIGILGKVQPYFSNDLIGQLNDYNNIFPKKENIMVIGDLNTTFSGRAFPSHLARNTLTDAFDKFNLVNLTKDLDNNVEQIVVSKNLIKTLISSPFTWNKEKKISDHIGICVEI